MSAEWSTNIPPELIPEKAEFRFDPQQWGLSEGDRMSEHTLDDLAARLAALDLEHADESPRPDYLEMWLNDLPTGFPFIMYRATDGHVGVDGPLIPETWPILDTIRQWQASAEPAPPPAAPVVTITPEMVERGRELTFRWLEAWSLKYPDDVTEFVRAVLDAALRGADLAPEGARDAVRG